VNRLGFRTLFHADWSVDPRKRWVTRALRQNPGWQVTAPRPATGLLPELFAAAGPVLAGFDFPIGLPGAYARQLAFPDFPAALRAFGRGEWADFYRVAAVPEEITLRRPFYPLRPYPGTTQTHLIRALGLASVDLLRRRCDHATTTRRAAAPLFWTVGPSQVGKAAIIGWQEILLPACAQGAGLWPFEGTLATSGALVLAEVYPTEARTHLGLQFLPGMSKRRQFDRRQAAPVLLEWARRRTVAFTPDALRLIETGFGPGEAGEDPFDSLIGLLGIIEVADGHRQEGPPGADRWEGWILGQIN
jgi:hypothetical protein